MKKILFAALLSAISISAYSQRPNLKDVAKLDRYKNENKAVVAGAVVFAGNSITDSWPGFSPEFFRDNNYIGRGISGQTSQGLLLRFRQDIVELEPAAVVINIGTNDVAENNGPFQHQLTIDCIKSMAELADYHGIKVILSSVLPVKQYKWNTSVTDAPEKIAALNAAIKSFAAERGFAYIDYYSLMSEPDGALKDAYGRDGVHPNKEGYAVMEAEANKVIAQVLSSKEKRSRKERKSTISRDRKGRFALGMSL